MVVVGDFVGGEVVATYEAHLGRVAVAVGLLGLLGGDHTVDRLAPVVHLASNVEHLAVVGRRSVDIQGHLFAIEAIDPLHLVHKDLLIVVSAHHKRGLVGLRGKGHTPHNHHQEQ